VEWGQKMEGQMRKRLFRSASLMLFLCAVSRSAWAGNKLINVQGKLNNGSGTALSGTYTLTFRLYTTLTGGTSIWSESQSVTVSTGLFNVSLGTATSMNSIQFNQPYYLGIQVAGDANELSPRQLLGASAYAQGSLGDFNVSGNLLVGASVTFPGLNVSTITVTSSATVTNITATNLTSSSLSVSTITAVSSATITNLRVSSLTVTTINGSWPNPNILIDGGMEFWQRGNSFTNPASGTYTADRWKVNTDAASDVIVSSESTTLDSGSTSMRVTVTGSPVSSKWYVQQLVEKYSEYQGKTISFSARLKCSVASACRIYIYDGVNAVQYSSYHSGSGNWETLTSSATISSSATRLELGIGFISDGDLQNGSYFFDSAMLVNGNQSVPCT